MADMSKAELQAMLEKLQAENETLRQKAERPVTLKVAEKGGLSVYGIGRFPVTLYKSQWQRLLKEVDNIQAFMTANDALLKTRE